MGWNPANWYIVNKLQGQPNYRPANESGYVSKTSGGGGGGGGGGGYIAPNATPPAPKNTGGDTSSGSYYGGGGSSASGATTDPQALAFYDTQIGNLQRQMGRADTALNQGLVNLMNSYNSESSKANTARSRALEDFGMQRDDTGRAKDKAIDKVNTNARVLADSLRRRIGLASGSGSSAYQVAAPKAVARQASGERTDVLGDFAQNYRALDTAEKRAEQDFTELLDDLLRQRQSRELGLRQGIEGQKSAIASQLADLAGRKAQASGGSYASIVAAMQPYLNEISARESTIDSLFNQFTSPYNVKQVNVQKPELKDYLVDRAAIQSNEQSGTEDPYAPYGNQLKQDEEEFNPLLGY